MENWYFFRKYDLLYRILEEVYFGENKGEKE